MLAYEVISSSQAHLATCIRQQFWIENFKMFERLLSEKSRVLHTPGKIFNVSIAGLEYSEVTMIKIS